MLTLAEAAEEASRVSSTLRTAGPFAQELLRHPSSKTTMEIYSHVNAAQQREAVEVLQRAAG